MTRRGPVLVDAGCSRARGMACAVAVVTCLAAGGGASKPAQAAGNEAPGSTSTKSAATEFDAGRRAYIAHDFTVAAAHFENAYHAAPRAESLRSAMRARMSAGDLTRAANLAALSQSRYPDDELAVALAATILAKAALKLHELQLQCTPDCGVLADGQALALQDASNHRLFVDPGNHEITLTWPEARKSRISVVARAGVKQSINVAAPPPGASSAVTTDGDGALRGASVVVPPPQPPVKAKPLSPVPFVIGASLTAALGAATVVSGLDALHNPGTSAIQTDCKDTGTSCAEYQQGLRAQLRTNILLGATLGVGVASAVVGLFFTQWAHAPATALGPASPHFAVDVLPPAGRELGTKAAVSNTAPVPAGAVLHVVGTF